MDFNKYEAWVDSVTNEFSKDNPLIAAAATTITTCEDGKVFVFIKAAYPLIFTGYETWDHYNESH